MESIRLKAKATVYNKHCTVANSVGVRSNKSHSIQLTKWTVMVGARLLTVGVRISQDNLNETNSTQLDLIYSGRKSQF